MAGALAELFGEHAEVRGARILGAIDAMPETRDLNLARQGALHPIDGGLLAVQLQQDLDDILICSAMQRTLKRADRRGDRRVNIGKRSGGNARGEGGGVQFMVR